jgi:transcriptional regulator with XRE-family HTH domain
MRERTFGQWLRRQIEEQLLTVAEFSRRLGVSRSQLNAWLSDRIRPRGVNIVRLSRSLKVSREVIEVKLEADLVGK